MKYTPIPQKTKDYIAYLKTKIVYQKNVILAHRRQIGRLVRLGQSILDHPYDLSIKGKFKKVENEKRTIK